MIVALDGPAGAGKSTLARALAVELGFQLIETGSLYRSVALAATRAKIGWEDVDGLTAVASGLDVVFEWQGGTNRVCLQGEDVTEALRTPAASDGASRVSALGPVRAALLGMQQRLGRERDTVMEGRDIGTVVFPDAEVKFFLTASIEERANRRFAEDRARGIETTWEAVRDDIAERDRRDCDRTVAPLRPADDATMIDTTGRPIDELVAELVAFVERARSGA